MRVVIDTNVFVSGVFFAGPPYRILEAWQSNLLEIVVSPEILEEYRRVGEVLEERHPGVELEPALTLLVNKAVVVDAPQLLHPVCRDRDDDKFLACAVAAGADAIVSGDKDLLDLRSFEEVAILSPRVFVDRYLQQSR